MANAIWRDTGTMPKIGIGGVGVDGRAIVLLVIWCVHWMWLTFWIMMIAFIALAVADFFGFDVYHSIRRIRRNIAGSIVMSRRKDQEIS